MEENERKRPKSKAFSREENTALNISEDKSSCRVEQATQTHCTMYSLCAAFKWIQREIYFIIIVIIIMSVTLSSLLVDFMHAYRGHPNTHTLSQPRIYALIARDTHSDSVNKKENKNID